MSKYPLFIAPEGDVVINITPEEWKDPKRPPVHGQPVMGLFIEDDGSAFVHPVNHFATGWHLAGPHIIPCETPSAYAEFPKRPRLRLSQMIRNTVEQMKDDAQ